MPFDDTPIRDITHAMVGGDLVIRWSSAAAAGTNYQVYVDRVLVWHGTATECRIPPPPGECVIRIGAVGPGEALTSFAATFPPPPGGGRRARIAWYGGTFQGDDLARFTVHASPGPGQPVADLPVATVTAYPGRLVTDGAGLGPAGRGGAGRSASRYEWTSGQLAPGVWSFAVRAIDQAGNVGEPIYWTATIAGPPPPPAPDARGRRLTGSVGLDTITLRWLEPNGT